MTITGKLGEVMQESVQAAKSYVRSRALDFGMKPPLFEKVDIHIHVPEGRPPRTVRRRASRWRPRSSRC